MTPHDTQPGRQLFAWAWLIAFLLAALTCSTVKPPHPAVLPVLFASGMAYVLWSARSQLIDMLGNHRAIWLSLAVLVASIAMAEMLAAQRGVQGLAILLPPSMWLVLCLPVLTVFLMHDARLRFTVWLFAAICIWHFFAMPFEAVTGIRLSWQPIELFPRDAGPLHYQAAGLAWQVYYFVGLFLPMFYLAWGPLSEGRITRWPRMSPLAWALLAMAWGLPAVATQSRSAFAGTMAAGLLALLAWRRPRAARTWIALGVLVAIGAASYWYLFSANKSGMDLRLAYYALYFDESMKWPAVLIGHGFTLVPNAAMFAKGFIPLEHSHNDLIQTLYSWGAIALLAYLAFFAALLALVWKRYVSRGRVWPLCALLVFIPCTVTDLGFQNFEKAVFIVLLTSCCLVFAREARLPEKI
ncbi:O-antigen ligase family protein [Caenimonas koreensis]|uniref:O-antigen ligase n=1 Tax=Caenimonas koreensis DSM 17982 TaxID=1121255 RepID=A0A844AY75_9BURK|nr:O-antigen ligase family protein [Caenimonas koreensis]MRD49500.1 hypothetical protein [Caenimonas koreensis DSM 17982]